MFEREDSYFIILGLDRPGQVDEYFFFVQALSENNMYANTYHSDSISHYFRKASIFKGAVMDSNIKHFLSNSQISPHGLLAVPSLCALKKKKSHVHVGLSL